MIKITLKDGSVKEVEAGSSVLEIAKSISEGLARVSQCGIVNGKVVDLRTIINEDCTLEICTFDTQEGKDAVRHSISHVLAAAVKRLFPEAKIVISELGKEVIGTGGGFLGLKLGEGLGLSKEESMFFGMIGSIVTSKGADWVDNNWDNLVLTIRYIFINSHIMLIKY